MFYALCSCSLLIAHCFCARSVSVPELGSGLDKLDSGDVRRSLKEVFGPAGILVVMYHLPREGREGRVRQAEAEALNASPAAKLKDKKQVSFDLGLNKVKEIAAPTIPGLVIAPTSKKKKKKKSGCPVSIVSMVKTPELQAGVPPSSRLKQLRKKLGKLEVAEQRLEQDGEEEMGREEREGRRRELEQEIVVIEKRLILFN